MIEMTTVGKTQFMPTGRICLEEQPLTPLSPDFDQSSCESLLPQIHIGITGNNLQLKDLPRPIIPLFQRRCKHYKQHQSTLEIFSLSTGGSES